MAYGVALRREANPSVYGGELRTVSTGFRDYKLPDRNIDFGATYFCVDSYGAVGDGVTDDSAAIQACANAAGNLGVVYYTAGKTYVIQETIALPISQYHLGYNATIKRPDAVSSLTTSVVNIGGTSVNVANPERFKIGDRVVIVDVTLPYGGRAHTESTNQLLVSNISGSTLTFSTPTEGLNMPIGSVLFKEYALFNGGASAPIFNNYGLVFEGLTFNGNRDNNNITNSWFFNRTINNMSQRSVIRDCFFYDIPCENAFPTNNSIITNNFALDCNGSLVHFSAVTNSETGRLIVEGNICRNMCLATQIVTGHSESAFVFSANPDKCTIIGNIVDGCSEQFMGPIYFAADDINIVGNKSINCNGVGQIANALLGDATNINTKNLNITGNQFINSGYLLLTTVGSVSNDTIYKNAGFDRVTIANNLFNNGKLIISRTSNVSITNNEIITDSNYTYPTTGIGTSALQDASIIMDKCTQYKVHGNTLDNRNTSVDSQLRWAIKCGYDNATEMNVSHQEIKSDVSTNTEYCYDNAMSSISGNTIINYRSGICDWLPSASEAAARTLSWIGFSICNNIFRMRPGSESDYAILAGPGTTMKGNEIYGVRTGTTPAVYLIGVNDGTGSTNNIGGTQRLRLNGPIFINNKIVGYDRSITVGVVSATRGNNIYNCIVEYNQIDGTISDVTSGNSVIANNRTLINESLIMQNIRSNVSFY